MANFIQMLAAWCGAKTPVEGDTLAYWAQAVGTVAAVSASIFLFAFQVCRDARRDKKNTSAVRNAIAHICRTTMAMAVEIHDPMNAYGTVGTWDQYKAFRSRQFKEFHDLIAALPAQDLTQAGLLPVAMSLRVNLMDLSEIMKESQFIGDRWRNSRHMIEYCQSNLTVVSQALGHRSWLSFLHGTIAGFVDRRGQV